MDAPKVPADVEQVVDRLLTSRHDASFVGGSVRDAPRGSDDLGLVFVVLN